MEEKKYLKWYNKVGMEPEIWQEMSCMHFFPRL